MFKWWNEPILPKSSVKWHYPLICAVLWLGGKFAYTLKFNPAEAAVEALTILLASIGLAWLQDTYASPGKDSPTAKEQLKKQPHKKKRKAKRHH